MVNVCADTDRMGLARFNGVERRPFACAAAGEMSHRATAVESGHATGFRIIGVACLLLALPVIAPSPSSRRTIFDKVMPKKAD